MSTILSADEIRVRIRKNEIFVPGTFDERNIRGASYDLRIGTDRLRLPDDDEGNPRIYAQGIHYRGMIVLRPGEVAFVTSQEEFQLASDLAGNIGVRFGLAGQGILIHTGLLVHPGFGRDRSRIPVPGQRLHFLLANLSPHDVPISRNEKVASIQFLEVTGSVPASDLGSAGRSDLEDRYIRDREPLGLGYLRQLDTTTREVRALNGRVEELDKEVDNRLRRVEQSSRDLIQFGVYIVAAAFLGVVFTELLSFLSDGDRARTVGSSLNRLQLTWPKAIVIAAVLFFLIYLIRWGLQAIGDGLKWAVATIKTHRQMRKVKKVATRSSTIEQAAGDAGAHIPTSTSVDARLGASSSPTPDAQTAAPPTDSQEGEHSGEPG